MAPDTLCAGVSRRRLLGIGAALALTGGPVLGEEGATTDDRFAALEADLANAVRSGFAPGLVGLVAQGDEVRVIPVGRMAEDGPPMQRNSIFRIASMTKPITAAAVMMLVDEGRLRLDEPVDRLLPELADRRVLRRIDGPVEDTVPGTATDHRRGPADLPARLGPHPRRARHPADPAGDRRPRHRGLRAARPGDALRRRRMAAPPRHPAALCPAWRGLDVHDRLGHPGRARRACLRPGLRRLPAGTDLRAARDGRHRLLRALPRSSTGSSTAYQPRDGKLELFDAAATGGWSRPPAFEQGDAGLVSTADDFLAFSRLLLSEGTHDGRRLLSEASVRAMTRNHLTPAQMQGGALILGPGHGWGYGMSVVVDGAAAGAPEETIGWIGGFGTKWQSDPATGLTTILLTQRVFESPEPPPVFEAFEQGASKVLSRP